MIACPERPSPSVSPLCTNPLAQLRRLIVTENESEVVITGTVSSYYYKQLAQEALRPALGSRRLLNRVEVASTR